MLAGALFLTACSHNSSLPPFTASGFAEDQGAVRIWRKDSGDNVHLLAVFSPWRSGDTTTREYRWQGDNLTLININVYSKPPVNIRALEPTSILCIPAKQLESCTSPHAFLLRENLSTEMSKKIGVLTQTLSVVGEPRLSDRIMAYLRTLPQDADGRVEVPMNRQEWATYLRAADKSLIRELSTLQKEGVLEVDGRFIRVL